MNTTTKINGKATYIKGFFKKEYTKYSDLVERQSFVFNQHTGRYSINQLSKLAEKVPQHKMYLALLDNKVENKNNKSVVFNYLVVFDTVENLHKIAKQFVSSKSVPDLSNQETYTMPVTIVYYHDDIFDEVERVVYVEDVIINQAKTVMKP